MDVELGLVGVDFNWALTIFYIFYLLYAAPRRQLITFLPSEAKVNI